MNPYLVAVLIIIAVLSFMAAFGALIYFYALMRKLKAVTTVAASLKIEIAELRAENVRLAALADDASADYSQANVEPKPQPERHFFPFHSDPGYCSVHDGYCGEVFEDAVVIETVDQMVTDGIESDKELRTALLGQVVEDVDEMVTDGIERDVSTQGTAEISKTFAMDDRVYLIDLPEVGPGTVLGTNVGGTGMPSSRVRFDSGMEGPVLNAELDYYVPTPDEVAGPIVVEDPPQGPVYDLPTLPSSVDVSIPLYAEGSDYPDGMHYVLVPSRSDEPLSKRPIGTWALHLFADADSGVSEQCINLSTDVGYALDDLLEEHPGGLDLRGRFATSE